MNPDRLMRARMDVLLKLRRAGLSPGDAVEKIRTTLKRVFGADEEGYRLEFKQYGEAGRLIVAELDLEQSRKKVRCTHAMAGTLGERCWLEKGHEGDHQRSPEPDQEWDTVL